MNDLLVDVVRDDPSYLGDAPTIGPDGRCSDCLRPGWQHGVHGFGVDVREYHRVRGGYYADELTALANAIVTGLVEQTNPADYLAEVVLEDIAARLAAHLLRAGYRRAA